MRKYLNNSNVPLSLAVYLATDHYDQQVDAISVTSLLKPIKQLILASRVPAEMGLVDVSSLMPSRMGTSLHDGIERAWMHNHVQALQALGYPQKIIDRVRINPKPEELVPGIIPVYLEQRTQKLFMGKMISGKFDFVAEGRLEDFKSTSVWTWINGSKDDDHVLQGSIYRWLNPDIITSHEMAIQFIFTDWSAAAARSDKRYPPSRHMERKHDLLSIRETEAFMQNKLLLLNKYWEAPEEDLPLCSDKELWRKEPVWKYYKNPAKTEKSTKNFDNMHDARVFQAQQGGIGLIKEVPGKAVACKYCPAFAVCQQAAGLVASGDLDL